MAKYGDKFSLLNSYTDSFLFQVETEFLQKHAIKLRRLKLQQIA